MNTTIESILNHRSIRSFTNQPIDKDQMEAILKTTQAGPSSINGQQMSVIVVTDQETKDKIAEYAGGQTWISQAPVFLLFVSDFYRAQLAAEKNNKELVIASNMEGTLVGSIDVGIALGQTIAVAESLGLGTVCIGGIRKNPEGMIELLDLPDYVYPMVGLCIGHPKVEDIPAQKPRLPRQAVVHEGKYNHDIQIYLDQYDETITSYMKARGGDVHNWSGFISSIYDKVYFPKVSSTLRSQKYACK